MNTYKKSVLITAIFSGIQILTILGLIFKRSYSYIFDSVFAYMEYLLIIYLEYKKVFQLEIYIKVLLVITIISHNLIGEFIGLYDNTLYFDKILHVFGTFTTTLFVYNVLHQTIKFPFTTKSQFFIFAVVLGIALGSIFEIAEFLLDVTLKVQNQRDLPDTNLDMICNIAGAAFAGALLCKRKGLLKYQGQK